jgi:hypothetical protein
VTALVVGGLILGGLPALAETFSPALDGRENHQQERIYQGVQSGQLTPQEFNRLGEEQGRIQGVEARMKADGNLDPMELGRLNAMLDKGSQDIFRARHNDRPASQAVNWQQANPNLNLPGSVDWREANQERRIYQGVRSGQLTPQEFNRLEAEQARIRAAEARMRADGRLDPRERARLNAMLDRSSQHIYRAEHNNQVAAPNSRWRQPHPSWGHHPGMGGQAHPYWRGQNGPHWRHANQQHRIHQGVRAGQITPAEFGRLQHQQARLQGAQARMRADGRFTPQDRGRLNTMMNRSSGNIYRARHNARTSR